jgi:glutamate---cysteine ligase / carboxylate-amine ligase
MGETFTIGIEEEYQIVNPETRDLQSSGDAIFKAGHKILGDKIKPEMHQCMIEVGTKVCRNAAEAREDLFQLRRTISDLAQDQGCKIVAASSHPFAQWMDQTITENSHYVKLVEDMQVLSRSLLIFGMHVHVQVEDRETAIHIMNAARYFLPHLLALSTSSPFWRGVDTGLKSYRCEIFKKYPRTEIPDHFTSLSEYQNYLALLLKTNCIDSPKKIWWDMRLHPVYPTIEYRICDIPTRAEDTIALAALMQAITAKCYKLIKSNLGFRLYRRLLIQENKWRALRYGINGKLIDFGKQEEVPVRDLIHELVEFVDDVVDPLGSRAEMAHIIKMLDEKTSADRQIAVYRETGDFKKVVDHLMEETMRDCSKATSLVPAAAAK